MIMMNCFYNFLREYPFSNSISSDGYIQIYTTMLTTVLITLNIVVVEKIFDMACLFCKSKNELGYIGIVIFVLLNILTHNKYSTKPCSTKMKLGTLLYVLISIITFLGYR